MAGPGPVVHAGHLVDRPPPAGGGDGKEEEDQPQLGAGCCEGGTKTCADSRRWRLVPFMRQAVHAKSALDNPVFPSYSIPKPLIRDDFASAIVRSDPTGWNIPGELDRLASLHTERDDVLDLELDPVADADTVPQPVIIDVDGRTLHAQELADERSKPRHRTTQLVTEHLHELVELRLRRSVVDEHTDPPVAVGHHLRSVGDERDLASCNVCAVDRSLPNVADESHHDTDLVGGAVVATTRLHGHMSSQEQVSTCCGKFQDFASPSAPGTQSPPLRRDGHGRRPAGGRDSSAATSGGNPRGTADEPVAVAGRRVGRAGNFTPVLAWQR